MLTSAGPFQQQFFSPSTSPLMTNAPFSNVFNGNSVSASMNMPGFYSPSASAYQSTASTPHAMSETDNFYFGNMDMVSQGGQPFRGQSNNFGGNASTQSFMYGNNNTNNTTNNGGSMFSASGTNSEPVSGYSTAPSSFGHIDPTQVFQQQDPHDRSPQVSMQNGNMFSFGGESDEEDGGGAFADRNMDMTGMEDNTYPYNASYSGKFSSTQAARYPGGPPRKSVTIGSTTTTDYVSSGDWDSNGMNRSQSQQTFKAGAGNGGERPQRLARASSTSSRLGSRGGTSNTPGDRTARSSPSSPPPDPTGGVSGLSSAAPSRPASPPGSRHGSTTNLQNAGAGQGGESSTPTTCTNCYTQTTPLWRRAPDGQPLCNACGLFLKLHGKMRPLSLKTDIIKKRNRGSGPNVGAGGARSKKSASGTASGLNSAAASRKNSSVGIASLGKNNSSSDKGANAPTAAAKRTGAPTAETSPGNTGTARTSGVAGSSSTGGAAGLHGSTGTSSVGGGGKGVVPIASAPPKAAPGPGASSLSRSATSSKRQRRHNNKDAGGEMDIDSPERGGPGGEKAGLSPGISHAHSATNLGFSSAFGLSRRPIGSQSMMSISNAARAGAMGNPAAGSSGPEEWEWLTMSL